MNEYGVVMTDSRIWKNERIYVFENVSQADVEPSHW